MNNRKRLLALLTALLMLLLSVCSIALAADDNMGDKTASPTTLTPDNRDTTVTLSLPSDEYKNKVDVVFVMDNSTSTSNSGKDFAPDVTDMFESIVSKNPNIELKVGVVKFRGYATDKLGGLTLYDNSSASTIQNAITDNNVPGSGSNIHSGLVMADQLLEEDTDVPNENKYVILLTDGKSYIWNNEANEPVTYYCQWYRKTAIQKNGRPEVAQYAGIYNKELAGAYDHVAGIDSSNALFSPVDSSDGQYYERLFNGAGNLPELANTATKYDSPCYYTKYYSVNPDQLTPAEGTYSTKNPTNGSTVHSIYKYYQDFTPKAGTVWTDMSYISVNPYLYDAENNVFDTSKPDEDFFLLHASPMEKGLYQAGHYWADVIGQKYKTGAVVFYDSTSGTGSHIAGSFTRWLEQDEISDFHVRALKEQSSKTWYYTDEDLDKIKDMLNDIDNSISYLVDKGSTVIDEIADDFTLKESDKPFTITVAGETLTCTKLGDNKWGFGSGGKYDYEISYDPGTKTITWNLNVPVQISYQVQLSYELTLREDAETGEYPTNKSAVLNYKTTVGDEGTFTFPIPKVTYTVNSSGITVTKVWNDNDNVLKLRPDSITVRLLSNGKEVASRKITKTDKWTCTFENLPDGEYTVKEDAVDGYRASVTGSSKDGFTVTNTLSNQPEPSKVPTTGDGADLPLWFGLLFLGIIGLGGVAAVKGRR